MSLDAVVAQLSENTVTSLDLTGSKERRLTDDDIATIAPFLKANTSLAVLNLSLNAISDRGAAILAKALGGNMDGNLKELTIGSNPITDIGLLDIVKALPATVVALDCSGLKLTAFFVSEFVRILRDTNTLSLTSLQLRDCGLGDEIWGDAPPKPQCPLTEYLSNNAICRLTTLHLSGNEFTDRSVPVLSNVVERNETLTVFNVSNTQIKDYFPIAEAVQKNDTLLLFPLASQGRKLNFSSVEPKLKENAKIRASKHTALDLKRVQEEHQIELRKVARRHQAEVSDLKATIASLQAQLSKQ